MSNKNKKNIKKEKYSPLNYFEYFQKQYFFSALNTPVYILVCMCVCIYNVKKHRFCRL